MFDRSFFHCALLVTIVLSAPLAARAKAPPDVADAIAAFELRNIGPALMSGRIQDIAVHPRNSSIRYVAVGSGGVWKTTNSGTTWTPIFEHEGSYSIGTVTLDPSAPAVVWVGTGENVSGRHVGFGDGVYRSRDGGGTWERRGLEHSEHISEIIVHPQDSNTVWVAAEGPLWSSGGERGVYRSTDGGTTWMRVLDLGSDVGVASLVADPRDPEVLYAAAYERRRRVWSLLAGGKGSGIYQSADGGTSWRRLTTGLPKGPMGKIGLAISPVDPDVVYATIEADPEEAGFYRSLDRGESWERRNGYISGGTGPHYYQEIYASPHDRDLVVQMDVFMRITTDGGKTFRPFGEPDKHSDNHAFWFDPSDPLHVVAGCDGGLYESFDRGGSWKFARNLPVTQIYKLAVDDDRPVYHVVGGTQDNGTQVGPVRTLNRHGIRNQDWVVAYGADGYATAVDPTNPDLIYVSWQNGHPLRYDRRTGELVEIQPQPEPGDPPERFNWDAPILISPHDPARLYYGSYRLWRSDDRGDSWRSISGDLTRNVKRYEQPVMGRIQSVDALWGNTAMSWYSTLTTIDESPLVEGLLYTGSDDGAVQVSEDGGQSWRRAAIAGAPERAFVNEVKTSATDPDVVFALLDNHKNGDLAPYVYRSDDRGRTWSSIRGNLPERHLVWSLAQDDEQSELLFLGTEYGVFATPDGGDHWSRLGSPTVAFRDLEIQRRADDLVAASFGRGFFVLDDYTPLRRLTAEAVAREAVLFPVRTADWFVPELRLANDGKGSSGSDLYAAPNPPFGAVVTYHLASSIETAKERRRDAEKVLEEKAQDVPFPGWEALRSEQEETEPRVLVVVRDADGGVVRRLESPNEAGLHRVAWDLRYPPVEPIELERPEERAPWEEPPRGPMAPPGSYTVELALLHGGEVRRLAGPEELEVRAARVPTLRGSSFVEAFAFQRRLADVYRRALSVAAEARRGRDRLQALDQAALVTPAAPDHVHAGIEQARSRLAEIATALQGDRVRRSLQEPTTPSILGRLGGLMEAQSGSRYGPTPTHRRTLELAEAALADATAAMRGLLEQTLPELEQRLEEAGAPWTPGRRLPPE